MTREITTLEQAKEYLIDIGVVDLETMTVEGKILLEVCGYAANSQKDITRYLKRQVIRHSLLLNVDYHKEVDVSSPPP